jgi:hypothetical protein
MDVALTAVLYQLTSPRRTSHRHWESVGSAAAFSRTCVNGFRLEYKTRRT